MFWVSCIISNIVLASALAAVAWCVQRWLHRPAIARALWLLVLIKLVTPPLVSVPWSVPGTLACTLGTCGCAQHAIAPAGATATFAWGLLAAWCVGAVATAFVAWRRWAHFRRLLAVARPAPRKWQVQAARLAKELSLRRPPEILQVPGRLPPLVVPGWRRPRMLLPSELLERLNRAQRATLLLHELTHLKRGDHLARVLEMVVSVAYWWLPMVGSIGRQLRTCEETSCDEMVVARRPQARRDYARLLLDVVDFSMPLPQRTASPATAMSAADDLESRLHAILDFRGRSRRAWPAGALALTLAVAVVPCGMHYDVPSPEIATPSTAFRLLGCPTASAEACAWNR